MISTSDLHLLGCHFEQYPVYQPRNLMTSKDHQEETKSQSNLGVFHLPIISFGFVFVFLGITCTIASIGIFYLLTHTHHTLQYQDIDISTWSSRFASLTQNKSMADSLMGFAFVEALARKDFVGKWRNALSELDLKKLEVQAMPIESAVLGLEDWVYNVARL
ncbi:hypothetical protein QBC32DRAFT_55020 [Pseudoneurospora amorphoporcata]|uniref:Uncharacterized protein n=1 Tax=Pseudoneurospora amorphoporcata TaxID=241081 RepID=A0AAN6NMV4_9PEZI|nr:hypothetical protein QBC32DRAFT_55020 [Pseudoneurospora amorphoporcata]